MKRDKTYKTTVLVIGGGATGTGIARDLALRGVECILAEQKDINAGASGGNHGLLHSGGRYVSNDGASAIECCEEGRLLKKLAPHCIDDTGGLFIAVEGDDENFAADFPGMCEKCKVPVRKLDLEEAKDLEPTLSDKMIAACQVEDASIDPFMLSLENISHARQLGAALLRYHKVVGFTRKGRNVEKVHLKNTRTGENVIIEADHVINAAGAWAGDVAALANAISAEIIYSKGTLLVTNSRITNQVVNRLRPPADGDILVPGGTVSILGTTSVRITALDNFEPTAKEVDQIVEDGAMMIPSLESTRYVRAYCGVRPLIKTAGSSDDRSVSRGFALIDHLENGLENFITIAGGKLTTFRLMAEKATDLVCSRLGVTNPCITRTEPFPAPREGQWTRPGFAPKVWLEKHDPNDVLLCECEMVPKSAIDCIIEDIRKQGNKPDLKAIGLRSRIGKGSCQGAFCALRIAAYMYDKNELDDDHGISDLKDFLNERWRGVHTVLWGMPLIQAELQEALHCGLLGMEH
ncbi:anaerobic glycerol-3-phosphate dehydrogenase subunit A [Desulfobacterales bacterium HSG16]|nr:anaerobic glycerol-3-phosphate dehydrogenase subunit A [Desulfobacterales bacterium HSG16]